MFYYSFSFRRTPEVFEQRGRASRYFYQLVRREKTQQHVWILSVLRTFHYQQSCLDQSIWIWAFLTFPPSFISISLSSFNFFILVRNKCSIGWRSTQRFTDVLKWNSPSGYRQAWKREPHFSLDVGNQNWLEAHGEPPTISTISPWKMALGVTNVQQNGLIRFPMCWDNSDLASCTN